MSSSSEPMGISDYIGFASMTLLLIGSVNWGVVAIRYAVGTGLPTFNATLTLNETSTVHEVYAAFPTPDLINLLTPSADIQMLIYWLVFASGIAYLLLFVWNSIELRTADA